MVGGEEEEEEAAERAHTADSRAESRAFRSVIMAIIDETDVFWPFAPCKSGE